MQGLVEKTRDFSLFWDALALRQQVINRFSQQNKQMDHKVLLSEPKLFASEL